MQATGEAAATFGADGWSVETAGAPDTAAGWRREGSVFALADGFLGVRGGVEELAGSGGGAFLNPVHDLLPIAYHERFTGFAEVSETRLPVADALDMEVRVDGVALGASTVERFGRRLDLRTGELHRWTRHRLPSGAAVEVEALRAVAGRGLLAARLRLRSPEGAAALRIVTALAPGGAAAAQGDDPRFGAGAGAALRTAAANGAGEGGAATLLQRAERAPVWAAAAAVCRARGLAAEPAAVEGGAVRTVFGGRLAPGEAVELETVAAYDGGPMDEARAAALPAALARRAAAASYEAVRLASAEAAARLWAAGAPHAGADAELTRALRFDLLQLHRSAPADGDGGLAAKGLTGEGYEGHVFWDSEAFALPVLALTAPDQARAQLRFRIDTLEPARRHARELNFTRGALYPWRTVAGREGSAYFPSGSAQLHINADIAWAVRWYDRAVGDDAFVLGEAAPVVWETARVWLQAGFHDPRTGDAFRICGVTGPDEYSALVDDDHFTQRMARAHLRYALELAGRAPSAAPHAPDAAERAAWAAAAAAVHLPVDPELGVHPQDGAFLSKPPWRFREDRADRPLLLHHHPLTLYRHAVLKQASVVQAHAMLPEDSSRPQMRRDWRFYEPRTAHDSTLSASAHAAVAAATGLTEAAARFLREGALVDLHDLHGNAGHGLHMAAMAGAWLALVTGFGGLRVEADGALSLLPQAPPELPAYGFGLRWRGAALSVEVADGGVRYRLGPGADLRFRHDGLPVALRPGEEAVRPAVRVGAPDPAAPVQAVVFDLDGVLTDTARAHYVAWKALADELGAPFDEAANEALKGVDRMGSLRLLLQRAPAPPPPSEWAALAERKNAAYRRLIAGFGPENLLPGAREALERLRAEGVATALASASRNAPELVSRLGIAHLLDVVVDPTAVPAGKPAPDIFLAAAAALRTDPGRCIAVEDSRAGLQAAKAAGMRVLGIGTFADLPEADDVVTDLSAASFGLPRKS